MVLLGKKAQFANNCRIKEKASNALLTHDERGDCLKQLSLFWTDEAKALATSSDEVQALYSKVGTS